MAKQLIISVLEDVVGEYILNISKENLKVAALRGKVKLENVQLDGELIGSHVLGAMGLSGFGVLSCWAKTLKMVVPLKNLEKEPTRFEIHGLHLVCVPLLPSTANKLYGSGTSVDPRCTLRTRAKRSALARFERNYFSGRIPGEGPPSRRVKRALKVANRELRKSRGKSSFKQQRGGFDSETIETTDGTTGDDEASDWNDESFYSDSFYSDVDEASAKQLEKLPAAFRIPIVQQGWKGRLREKMLGNVEASIYDIHVRCEVSENGLDFGQSTQGRVDGAAERLPAEQRAFSFGITMKSCIVRSADENWEYGTDRRPAAQDDDYGSSEGEEPKRRDSKTETEFKGLRRIGIFNDVSIYWDDEPPLLISETTVLNTRDHRLSVNKLQSRIAAAMEALSTGQDPGEAIRRSLFANEASSPTRKSAVEKEVDPVPHEYCVKSFFLTMRGILSELDRPGPRTLSAEVLPVNLEMTLAPHQHLQYKKLSSAMLSQQRFDTMAHQRPAETPLENPAAWWKYAIGCVMTRPTSRPWSDVLRIARSRKRYIELVKKKILRSSDGVGYHAGLNFKESVELLAMENMLPIEALLAFHLLACRSAFEEQRKIDARSSGVGRRRSETAMSSKDAPPKARRKSSFKRIRRAFGSSVGSSKESGELPRSQSDVASQLLESTSFEEEDINLDEESLLEVIRKRLGKKKWFNTFQVNDVRMAIDLVDPRDKAPFLRLEARANGTARSFGPGKQDFLFDLMQFDVTDRRSELSSAASTYFAGGKLITVEEAHLRQDVSSILQEEANATLPEGVVCRISCSRDIRKFNLGVSALPATFVWNKASADTLSEFFSNHTVELNTELTKQLRSAATPLARRAQLALLTPSTVQIDIDVAAPKLWVPISPDTRDGAVYLDAGHLKIACRKGEEDPDSNWNVMTRDIQVVFIRRKGQSPSVVLESEELRVVKPFHVQANIGMTSLDDATPSKFQLFSEVASAVQGLSICNTVVAVSPICLNLLDAEILARAIGQWYASGLVQAKQRVAAADIHVQRTSNMSFAVSESVAKFRQTHQESTTFKLDDSPGTTPHLLTASFEKLELALEGHSKNTDAYFPDDQSVTSYISQDTFGATPRKRTYVVEIVDVRVERAKYLFKTQTNVSVHDASVLQLKEAPFQAVPRSPFRSDIDRFPILRRGRMSRDPEHSLVVSKGTSTEGGLHDRFGDISNSRLDSSGQLEQSTETVESTTLDFETPAYKSRPIVSAKFLHDGDQYVDEMEIDVEAIVVCITPLSLKDCAKATRRGLELVQLMTKEMERKVHEEGRKARKRVYPPERRDGERQRSTSPISSVAGVDDMSSHWGDGAVTDSSLLIRVTMQDITILAGHQTSSAADRKEQARLKSNPQSNEVVQLLSKALFMFQSVENLDASGVKTLHVSLDNMSTAICDQFERLEPSESPPVIGPSAAEVRVVYVTENQGCVVSQDVTVDCEATHACFTPQDALVMANVSRSIFDRLRSFGQEAPSGPRGTTDESFRKPRPSLLRYQKKGTGIATSIQVETQLISVVLLRPYEDDFRARPFFDLQIKHFKGNLAGCMSALSGEVNAFVVSNYFNNEIGDWEYVIEPLRVSLSVDQMPNELVLKLKTVDSLQLNLTSTLMNDLADMDLDIFRTGGGKDEKSTSFNRSADVSSITLTNLSGIDIRLLSVDPKAVLDASSESEDCTVVEAGAQLLLDPLIGATATKKMSERSFRDLPTISLSLASSSADDLGDREVVVSLPIATSSSQSASLHRLQPVGLNSSENNEDLVRMNSSGRHTPESTLSEAASIGVSEFAYYNAEPVVEWCMENQRLRSNIADVFSLEKGKDILSSRFWSPEDQFVVDPERKENQGHEPLASVKSWKSNEIEEEQNATSPERKQPAATSSSKAPLRSNWVRPYLKEDSPEWTDMTCMLRMARERVMLPDSNWIWLNDWTVDLSGSFGDSTDADGWEYEADFETFNKDRRFYQRGDSCRRRRWTRTRMVKPPRFDDPFRRLSIVWETKRSNGSHSVVVRSPLTLHNRTDSPLAFFAYTPSWDADKFVGIIEKGAKLVVPVPMASAAYIRFGRPLYPNREINSIDGYVLTRRVMILPTSYTSSAVVRTTIDSRDFRSETSPTETSLGNMHFLVCLECVRGVTDIFIEPVLQIINLLPCQLQCEIGEVTGAARPSFQKKRRVLGGKGKKKRVITGIETMTLPTGDDQSCTTVNPAMKPHLSFRVPGYQWSPWIRVVNRKANSYTWRPSDTEEDYYLHLHQGDGDNAEEFKTCLRFERIGKAGDPLVLIVGVEVGHCPTIRVYAQYWILDKTGFGCRFCDGFVDLLGTVPDGDTSRRSHLLSEEANDPDIQDELTLPGHQWSIGMNGMSLFFSRREKIALSIETGGGRGKGEVRSKWVSPLDISNVIPKTVFSVDEHGGPRRFDLAISVTVCPATFARTKLITLYPRFQIVNLLQRKIIVAQDGCLQTAVTIPAQASMPLHRERRSLPPKVRLGAPSALTPQSRDFEDCWTNGSIQLDKIGITSMRIPTSGARLDASKPMVVQVEVRLATKDQSSAVVIVVWATDETSNPLYVIRNTTSRTILCRQPLHNERDPGHQADNSIPVEACSVPPLSPERCFECGVDVGPMVEHFLGMDNVKEFVWILREGDVACFGFDDPEKPHIIEWASVGANVTRFDKRCRKSLLEVDAMGSFSSIPFSDGREVCCRIVAEHSTKVIEFTERRRILKKHHHSRSGSAAGLGRMKVRSGHFETMLGTDGPLSESNAGVSDDDEQLAFSIRFDFPEISISIIDNATPMVSGREILAAHLDKLMFEFAQNREGYHEFELRLMSLQVDNHVHKSIHPVLIFCPKLDEKEPLVHMAAVRRLQPQSTTFVFRYAAVRILEIDIFLDRRTAETIARFVRPIGKEREAVQEDPDLWVRRITESMARQFARPDRRAPRDIEQIIQTANAGRIYFEQLHLHPVRLALTFTQEWMEWNPGSETLMIFQFIRGMASIANAPLTFNSFVVAHVFESPQALIRIVGTHYSSQLTKQIFGILGSLAILGAPADFISNVGTGVRDFFYEPINGLVHGPAQFIEGLEAGTSSLARGVFVGVMRGAANVTEVVNANLAELTADDTFIDERKAHHRMLTDAMSRGVTHRSIHDSLYLAGESIARSVKSGAVGIMEQPTIYASKHGPVGFVKGMGKAMVGAVLKPVVGLGDAAVLVMNHVSDSTSDRQIIPKIPKRLRRALPRLSSEKPHCVQLSPYDDRAAKAQKIVTGGESVDDVYIGHVNIPSHLIIASEQCLWAIDRRSREPWCVSWEEISHFGMLDANMMRITVFSQTGLKSYVFEVTDTVEFSELHHLLSMQLAKMGNATSNVAVLSTSLFNGGLENLSKYDIPGIKVRQVDYVFGSCNKTRTRLNSAIKDEIDVIEKCFGRVKKMGSESPTFFKKLDEEAWNLVNSWGQVFTGLSSRRCIVASIINGTGNDIQIKSTKLVEGGSPCYSIPTKEYDAEQGVLHPGGAIIFFAWGVVPSLLQAGNVFMNIETNAFVSELSDHKTRATVAEALSGYQVGFLEKSYDESGWWAKYWLLVRRS